MIGNLFQIINFLIFTSLMIYVIRKYIAPQLREALVKQYREFVGLTTEHDKLAVDQKDLEKSIELQEDEAMTLFKKINKWRNVVAQQKKSLKLEDKLLLEQSHAKARNQLDRYALKHAYTQLVPLVTERLEHELSEQFKDETKGHEYLQTVLEEL